MSKQLGQLISEGNYQAIISKPFPYWFVQQVKESPDNTAVRWGALKLSYQELHEKASAVSFALHKRGASQQSVAVLMERSGMLLSAMIGIFYSGNTYLPLDPDYPLSRLVHTLRISGCTRLIVTKNKYAIAQSLLQEHGQGVEVILWEDIELPYTAKAEAEASEDAEPQQAAYVIFTSGSTGLPKGAMVSHKGMMNHLLAKVVEFGLTAQDRIIQNASQCFDISVWQFLSLLVIGGEVLVVDRETAGNPALLFATAEHDHTTVLEVVPSVLRFYLDEVAPLPLSALRMMVVTGEALKPDLVSSWFRKYLSLRLINAYGPTECSDDVTHFIIDKLPEQISAVSIGKPIINTELAIIKQEDDQYVRCGCDEKGELWITGDCLGLGYINNDAQTKKAFVQLLNDGKVYYRTGDLVSCSNEGYYFFHGRIDRQVKVHGYRVELEEIENKIKEHAAVKDCIVYVKEYKSRKLVSRDVVGEQPLETQHLVAYVIAHNAKAFDWDFIKVSLKDQLPHYMVPHVIMLMEQFPISKTSGKIDYDALPEITPDNINLMNGAELVPPASDMEHFLHRQMCALIGASNISVTASLYEAGFDSLKLMQLLNRLNDQLNTRITFSVIYQNLSVRTLAAYLDNQGIKATNGIEGGESAPVKTLQHNHPYPLTDAQKRIWFMAELEQQNPYYNFSSLLTFKGAFDLQAFQATWLKLLQLHPNLTAKFSIEQDGLFQYFQQISNLSFPVIDLSAEANPMTELRSRAVEAARVPFNLMSDQLVRFNLYRISDMHYELQLTTHEIVLDGWGACNLVKEFCELYDSGSGKKYNLRPLDFIRYLDEMNERGGQENAHHRQFWSNVFTGLPLEDLQLPFDHARPLQLSYKGGAISDFLDFEETAALKKIANDHECSLFVVLNALLKILLHRFSGQEHIVVGSPIANRNSRLQEELVGFHINMIPTVLSFSSGQSFADVLQQEKHFMQSAIEHSELSFIDLIDLVNPPRKPNVAPLFQVMFNMLNFPFAMEKRESFEVDFKELEIGYTKYDLSFYAQEADGSLYLQLSFMLDIFLKETAQRFMKAYKKLVQQVVNDPLTRVSALSIVPEEELLLGENLLQGQAATGHTDFQELIDQLMDTHATKEVLVWKEESYTVQQFFELVQQVSDQLTGSGLRAQEKVVLDMERSPLQLAAIYALTKNSIPYLPLNERFPAQLKAQLCLQSGAKYLLSDKPAAVQGMQVIVPEKNGGKEYRRTEELQDVQQVHSVIYTSGSTGAPKAVPIKANAILNRLHWMWQQFPFIENDVLLLHKPVSVVGAYWELFGGILQGVKTIYLDQAEQKDPQRLWHAITQNKVTYFHASPAMIEGLLLYLSQAAERTADHLRLVTASAEALTLDVCRRWNDLFPQVPLINMYGLTECSSHVSFFNTAQYQGSLRLVPLGFPINNVQFFVADMYGNACAAGVEGEILISGACLFNDAESNGQNMALYKTGDYGFWNENGINFTRRKDNQVQVNGHRVDLSFVEQVLEKCEGVCEACVTLQHDGANAGMLASYVVLDDRFNSRSFFAYLRATLPDYMQPGLTYKVEQLPKAPTGKVIRTEIDALEKQPVTEQEAVAPVTKLQEELLSIWVEVLRGKQIGITDNFFMAGGNSMKSIQLFSKINKRLHIRVTVRDIFTHPTVESFAEFLLFHHPKEQTCFALSDNSGNNMASSVLLVPSHSFSPVVFQAMVENTNTDVAIYGYDQSHHSRIVSLASVQEQAAMLYNEYCNKSSAENHTVVANHLGAAVAFEMAKQLEKTGKRVQLVLINPCYEYEGYKSLDKVSSLRLIISETYAKNYQAELWARHADWCQVQESFAKPEDILDHVLLDEIIDEPAASTALTNINI